MQYVRIFARATVDNPDEPPLIVDVIIDKAGNILGRHTVFGVQGAFARRDTYFYPFTLDSDGQLDYGTGFDQPANERYAKLVQ
jgi:hypothetical protein